MFLEQTHTHTQKKKNKIKTAILLKMYRSVTLPYVPKKRILSTQHMAVFSLYVIYYVLVLYCHRPGPVE